MISIRLTTTPSVFERNSTLGKKRTRARGNLLGSANRSRGDGTPSSVQADLRSRVRGRASTRRTGAKPRTGIGSATEVELLGLALLVVRVAHAQLRVLPQIVDRPTELLVWPDLFALELGEAAIV